MAIYNDFLGQGWGFPPAFTKETGGVNMVSDDEDIQQSLRILFNTTMGERIMLPKYGCNLKEFLFREIDTSFVTYMKDMIANAILRYESRIDLDDLEINSDNEVDGVILVEISYTIRKTNSRNNIVFPFYLIEGTLIDN
jgi:phage baseplate assembly protein W